MSLMTEECILRIRGHATDEKDDFGNPIIAPGRDEQWPCWYEPRGSTEDTSAKDQQIHGYWLYLPLLAPLRAADAVLIEGLGTFEVVGKPARQPGGFLVPGYFKVALEEVTG